VSKSKVGGNTAVEKLLKNFKLVIISQARAIYANGYDLDELIQMGLLLCSKLLVCMMLLRVYFLTTPLLP
jgi:hypothetical protein